MIREQIERRFSSADEKTIKRLINRAEILRKRGLGDESVILQLITDEYNQGYKEPGFLWAGMYDKMNHMCRCYMDRTVRLALYYDYIPDVETLKKVIICLFEKAPIFHSKFQDNHIVPCWIIEDYNIDEVFSVRETDNMERDIYIEAVKSVDVKSNVQLRFILFTQNGKSALFFRWNHMVFDGGGFRQLMKDITDNYHRFRKGETDSITFRTGTRKYNRVYKDMEHGKEAKKKYKKTFNKDKKALPYTKKSESDEIFISKRTLPYDVITKMIGASKACGGTINDVFVSAYLRACYRLIGCDKNESMTISCAMDLRRYIKDIDSIGYTNHTSFMPCVVEKMGDSIYDTIRELSNNTKALKADEFNGLYGLPLLNIGYCTMIYLQAELVVKSVYYNANLQVTNMGVIGGDRFQFDGHDITDAFIGGSAKYKPTSAVCVYTVGDKLIYTQPIKGNEKDREVTEKLFDLIEEELRSL